MKVLVTGGAGFIGSALCSELLSRGHKVRVLDDLSSGRRNNLDRAAVQPGFLGLVEGSVAEERPLRESLAGVDTVFHIAGRASVRHSVEDPGLVFANDVAASFRLLEEVRLRRLRLIYVSSCSVYQSALEQGALSESSPTAPATPHAGCRLATESMVLSYGRSYGLEVTVVRPFNTYGPAQRVDAEGGVVSMFCKRALLGQALLVHGDGAQRRDLLYVGDLSRLLRLAAETGAASYEVVNAGTGLDVSIGELAQRVRAAPFAKPGTTVEFVQHPGTCKDIHRLRCDPTKAQRLLNFRAEVALDEGLARTAAWLKGL